MHQHVHEKLGHDLVNKAYLCFEYAETSQDRALLLNLFYEQTELKQTIFFMNDLVNIRLED